MSEALIVRRGGSGKLYAVIAVSYPAGSICTCTNGTKTLKAKDTGGRALFKIPGTGTWTASCTDGTDTDSKAVSITAEGQCVSVTLDYALWLYNMGNQYTDRTGGWKQTGTGGSVSVGTDTMTVNANSYQKKTNAVTTNKIDLTGIKTLHFLLKSATTYATGYPRIGISPTDAPDSSKSGSYVASKTLSASSDYVDVALDVSTVTGSFFVSIGGLKGDAGAATITVQKVWGEYS